MFRRKKTGTPRWNAHGNDICFQIDADFIGLSCPAMPRTAVQLIDPPARLIAWGDGLYAGSFIAGMYTKAYFETDPVKIVEAGLACLPPQSTYAQVIRDVLQWHRENPSADDWQKVWKLLQDKWDGQDFCTYGAMNSLNIDAKINGAYVAIGLLYGGDDFTKVLEIATRCGQDSDCNPCTACGIWAAARGYDKIPQRYTMGIPAMADEKFSYTDASFNSAVEHTIKRAIDYVKAAGGRVENDRLIIVEQSPTPAKTRDFNIGKPVGRIACDDPRWTWSGPWKSVDAKKTRLEKVATEKGAEATIKFTGTGAAVVGPFTGSSGRADVYLDGKLNRTVDAWPDEDRREAMQALWHKYDLIDGEHTVRVVVRGETYGESKGTEIRIHSLVVFR